MYKMQLEANSELSMILNEHDFFSDPYPKSKHSTIVTIHLSDNIF